MKDCDLTGKSNKKANGRTATGKFLQTKLGPKLEIKRAKSSSPASKKIMGAGSSKAKKASKTKAGRKTTNGNGRKNGNNVSPRKGSNKHSPESRPRRRASQTYFFKYQLARNPLKAEEEDLKLALLASLQQCANNKNSVEDDDNNDNNNNNNKNEAGSTSSSGVSNNCNDHNTIINGHSNNHNNTNHKYNNSNDTNHHHGKSNSTTKTKQTLSQTKEEPPPDEDNLKKYKPETEDFLTFICFRTTIANNRIIQGKQSPNAADPSSATNQNGNLKQQCNNSSLNRLANINYSPTSNDNYSPNNHRRPTRQSPRLASSNRKISENDSTSNTAYDNSINYEEDMKRASIALEDMAQEINSSDGMNIEIAQNSPFKNNKHLVKGLMTREFAGAFADEQTIFESISNHKL